MLLRLDDVADHEAFVFTRRVFDRLDLESDAGQRVDDLAKRGRGVEVVFEPGEGEFHRGSVCTVSGLLDAGVVQLGLETGSLAPGAFAPRSMLATLMSSSISGQWIPSGESSTRDFCSAVAATSRGYHQRGVWSTRPSARVTVR